MHSTSTNTMTATPAAAGQAPGHAETAQTVRPWTGPAMAQGQRAQPGVFEAGLLTAPGLAALRQIHAGRSPQPPIHHWSGRKLVALQHGEAWHPVD